jgi:hypothetical protein
MAVIIAIIVSIIVAIVVVAVFVENVVYVELTSVVVRIVAILSPIV